jgi:hypothetical protein
MGDRAVRQLDVAAMFASLWLLVSMILDAVTPKELTVLMIGPATAPAFLILAVAYWRRVPKLDFAIMAATLWMATLMLLEFITPKPLSLIMAAIAIAPAVTVGCVVNFTRWRNLRSERARRAQPSS